MNTLQTLLVSVILSLFVGGFIGWKVGSSKVSHYKAQLELIRTQAQLAKDKFEQDKVELEKKTEQIQVKAREELTAAKAALDVYLVESAKLSARKDAEIKTLKFAVSSGKLEVTKLQERIGSATSDAQRIALEEELKRLQALLDLQEVRVKGLECLAIPVPEEYLVNLNSI